MMRQALVALALLLGPTLIVAQTTPTKKKDKKKKDKKKNKPTTTVTGQVFVFRPDAPTWATCDIELRDPSDELWPNFFYGRPSPAGTLIFNLKVIKPKAKGKGKPTVKAARTPQASFTLAFDRMAQRNGDQRRRVLGELGPAVTDAGVVLAVTSLGTLRSEQLDVTDDRGNKERKWIDCAPFGGTLAVGSRQVPVQGRAIYRFNAPGGGPATSISLDLRFTVNGRDLGLKKLSGPVECRAEATGYASTGG
jgi:hypothetical protein